LHRSIPSSGESLPVIGMGSWLTFDVGSSPAGRNQMGKVMAAFVKNGGRLIDSSPMYGSSEVVIGDLSQSLDVTHQLWIATKVWTHGSENGRRQISQSRALLKNDVKLHQIHNLRDLDKHYRTLREMKENGSLPYIGVTHYLSSEHNRLATLLKDYPVDFLQINYNIDNPKAENILLPTAADLGVAVIVNRPFQTGRLFDHVAGYPVPEWIKEYGVQSWATYFLKFILANRHVTCAIPATTQVDHVIENLSAADGWIPTIEQQKKMLKDYQEL